ncbi:MAG: hypothetical protein IEMM0002_0131 [bacterium]|nr:MAG: hypothetical protein IEMM0002_0131 [bacterium]
MNKIELQKSTKQQLVKTAKKQYGLLLNMSQTKDEMISIMLNAARTARKLTLVKAAKGRPKMRPVGAGVKKSKTGRAAAGTTAKKLKLVTGTKGIKRKPAPIIKIKKIKSNFPEGPKPSSPSPSKPERSPAPALNIEKETVAVHAKEQKGEEAVQDSKYYVAPVQEHLHPTHEPPERYEDDRMVAFARDPFWLFSFWDINPETRRRVAERSGLNGSGGLSLRVYDITGIYFNGQNANSYFDIDVNAIIGNWYVNVPRDGRVYCMEVGLKDASGGFFMLSRSNPVAVPRASVSDRIDEEWMIADEDFWKLYGLSGGFGSLGSSEEISEAMQERLKGETSSGAISSFGASEMMARKSQDSFWFNLDCELIVYGATEPDAEVSLAGNPVELRPDGTFTERFSLPDGIRELPARAVSADRKYEKTIAPTVSRSTASFNDKSDSEE